jgi:hypothetical protein
MQHVREKDISLDEVEAWQKRMGQGGREMKPQRTSPKVCHLFEQHYHHFLKMRGKIVQKEQSALRRRACK